MMIYLAGLVGFLLVLTADAGVGSSSELSFCNETPECLLFDLICQTDNYEVRHYDSVKWVSTTFTSPSLLWWFGVVPAFWRLKNYLDENKISMRTAPVIVKIPPEDPPKPRNSVLSWLTSLPKLTREYSISFLLPADHQNNPSQPSNPKVQIEQSPDMYVFVKSYKGWVKDDPAQAKLLFASLNMTDYESLHYAVGYNSPMNANPHSEVWVVADGKPQCPSK